MFRHLLKLTWKRKTRSLLLSLEILLAFALVFAISAFAIRSGQLYRMPLGFDGQDVWVVSLSMGDAKIDRTTLDAFKRGLHELPEVSQVSLASFEPYSMSGISGTWNRPGGGQVHTDMLQADDDTGALLGLHLARGRWFSSLDDGSARVPVVVNRRLASAMFGDREAVGQQFDDVDNGVKIAYQVVGVVDEYRAGGELSAPKNFAFIRFVPGVGEHPVRTLLLKVRPGTARSFEAGLSRRLKLVRNDWSYEISPLSSLRQSALRAQFTPLVVLAVVAGFMLLMAGFGLFGALWQNTTRRIPEIGLRRAVGASAAAIYRQIVAEQLLLSSVAIVVGLALLVQLPLTGALGEHLNWTVFAAAAGLSMFVIYLISLLCSLYPGWRASRLTPTQALHHE
jgi:putative ABC transport system permease protein